MIEHTNFPSQVFVTEQYKVTLVVMTNPRPNDRVTVDEICYVEDSIGNLAREKFAEIQQRAKSEEIRRKVILVREFI